jgi:hypothetical protein
LPVEAIYNDKGALCYLKRISTSAPQFFGRSPQGEGEESNSYAGQGSDGALINVSSMGGAKTIQAESDEELDDKERLFMKGSVFLVILVLMYAVSKRI